LRTTYCIKCAEERNDLYMVLCTVNLKINIMMEGIGGEIAKQLFNKLLIPFAIVFVAIVFVAIVFAIGFALGAWLF